MAVTLYATGVVIGAPVLTALASGWSRKRLLPVAMLAFTVGNVLAALSDGITVEAIWSDPLMVAVAARHPLLSHKRIQLGEVLSSNYGS